MRRYVAAVALVLLAGCSTPQPTSSPTTTTAPIPTDGNDVEADLPTPAPAPTDDDVSDAAARLHATQTMTAFVATAVTPDQWTTALRPYLTEQAAQSYAYVDPAEVPAHALTGDARLEPSPSAYLAQAIVPTDVGEYRLLLVRDGGGQPWLTQTITPPDGVQ